MRHLPFSEVRTLCTRLIAARESKLAVEQLVRDAVRSGVLDKDSLPFVVQNVGVVHRQWQLALRVLQSRDVHARNVRLDANIWRILAPALPQSGDGCAAAQRVLCALAWERPTAAQMASVPDSGNSRSDHTVTKGSSSSSGRRRGQ